jgi:hypothetical protein
MSIEGYRAMPGDRRLAVESVAEITRAVFVVALT